MIIFQNVSKRYHAHRGEKCILAPTDCTFPSGHNVGILGGNGVGKSTLMRMIAGAEEPDTGRIRRSGRVSFPLGFSGTFHPYLTGRQNTTFVARVYGENIRKIVNFVADFAELDDYFDMPIHTYSAGMHARLAFALSLAIDFDVYLIDEVTAVGDIRFRQKCDTAFRERMARSDIIMVSQDNQTIRAYCDVGAVLADGRLQFFPTIEEAMQIYRLSAGTQKKSISANAESARSFR
jgi:capsular polysaccharide transport system ATP-binding protein